MSEREQGVSGGNYQRSTSGLCPPKECHSGHMIIIMHMDKIGLESGGASRTGATARGSALVVYLLFFVHPLANNPLLDNAETYRMNLFLILILTDIEFDRQSPMRVFWKMRNYFRAQPAISTFLHASVELPSTAILSKVWSCLEYQFYFKTIVHIRYI